MYPTLIRPFAGECGFCAKGLLGAALCKQTRRRLSRKVDTLASKRRNLFTARSHSLNLALLKRAEIRVEGNQEGRRPAPANRAVMGRRQYLHSNAHMLS